MTGNSQNFARIKLGIKLISDSVYGEKRSQTTSELNCVIFDESKASDHKLAKSEEF